MRSYYTPEVYDRLIARKDVIADRIVYESDGLKIAGFLVEPVHHGGRLPVIIWCRGGKSETGALTTGDVLTMSNWARRGYIVIASQYRGGPDSEGHDEFGGADVDDVVALAKLSAGMPEAEPNRLYLYGYSRGGMMVYRAMAGGLAVKAAAVNSGLSDLDEQTRPDLAADYSGMMPDYFAEAANHFCRRSAICWPQKLAAPLLILHGDRDWRVPVHQAVDLDKKLLALGKPVSLVIVHGGNHVVLDDDQAGIDDEILGFFGKHRD